LAIIARQSNLWSSAPNYAALRALVSAVSNDRKNGPRQTGKMVMEKALRARSSNAGASLFARLLRDFPHAAQPSKLDQDPSGSAHEVVGRLLELIESLGRGTHHRRFECFAESLDLSAHTITYARIETT
jgi:hypothetical protein